LLCSRIQQGASCASGCVDDAGGRGRQRPDPLADSERLGLVPELRIGEFSPVSVTSVNSLLGWLLFYASTKYTRKVHILVRCE